MANEVRSKAKSRKTKQNFPTATANEVRCAAANALSDAGIGAGANNILRKMEEELSLFVSNPYSVMRLVSVFEKIKVASSLFGYRILRGLEQLYNLETEHGITTLFGLQHNHESLGLASVTNGYQPFCIDTLMVLIPHNEQNELRSNELRSTDAPEAAPPLSSTVAADIQHSSSDSGGRNYTVIVIGERQQMMLAYVLGEEKAKSLLSGAGSNEETYLTVFSTTTCSDTQREKNTEKLDALSDFLENAYVKIINSVAADSGRSIVVN